MPDARCRKRKGSAQRSWRNFKTGACNSGSSAGSVGGSPGEGSGSTGRGSLGSSGLRGSGTPWAMREGGIFMAVRLMRATNLPAIGEYRDDSAKHAACNLILQRSHDRSLQTPVNGRRIAEICKGARDEFRGAMLTSCREKRRYLSVTLAKSERGTCIPLSPSRLRHAKSADGRNTRTCQVLPGFRWLVDQRLLKVTARQQRHDFLRRQRTAEQIALHFVASDQAQQVGMLFGFHPFGADFQPQRMG